MRNLQAMAQHSTTLGVTMLAISIHRINNLELRAESITNNASFLNLHINCWTSPTNCHSVVILKGPTTAEFIQGRAFHANVPSSDLLAILQIGFKFLSDAPKHTPLYTHLQYLYPEYFI